MGNDGSPTAANEEPIDPATVDKAERELLLELEPVAVRHLDELAAQARRFEERRAASA